MFCYKAHVKLLLTSEVARCLSMNIQVNITYGKKLKYADKARSLKHFSIVTILT